MMAVDTPATIVILGAGPVGVEAALYARYLGYSVIVLEQNEVASQVTAWGHLPLFSPFAELRSTLGLAALRAQDPAYRPPAPDARLSGRQWVDQYLLPLSRTDLLADVVRCGERVVAVGRELLLRHEGADDEQPDDGGFRLLIQRADGRHTHELADIVLDCTGTYANPNGCGTGGMAARGEARWRPRIEYGVPDVLDTRRSEYADRRVLVVGHSLEAAATVVAVAQLAQQVPGTRVTWSRHPTADTLADGPIPLAEYGYLPAHQQLALAANKLAQGGTPGFEFRPTAAVAAVDVDDEGGQFIVQWSDDAPPERFDRIVVNAGHRPDHTLYEELQIARSPITDGPTGMGEHPADDAHAANAVLPPERLMTPEPNFYILGAKSFGRDERFLLSDGLRQIRDLFGIIGGRPQLDLYATAERLAQP
jgi:hypothetical protein